MEHLITNISDKDGHNIEFNSVELVKITHKFSNTKKLAYRIVLDGTLLKKKETLSLKACYECQHCGTESQPHLLHNIIRKLRNGTDKCMSCKEDDDAKRARHSEFMRHNGRRIRMGTYTTNTSNTEPVASKSMALVLRSQEAFKELSDSQQSHYFQCHYHQNDELLNNIVSVDGITIDKLEYFDCILIQRTVFFPRFRNKENDNLVKPFKIIYRCIRCKTEARARQLSGIREGVPTKCAFMCKKCAFVSRRFPVHSTVSCIGQNITYQGGLEKTFVDFCVKHHIPIEDGPKIPYKWIDTERMYHTDFYLPGCQIVLELKGRHPWHIQQVESGKWGAKEDSAKRYCEEQGIEYKLVFDNEIEDFKKWLESRYDPTRSESCGSEV